MIDFLKAFPFVTKEEYLWSWTVPQVELAANDNTHIEHLTEEQAKIETEKKNAIMYSDPSQLLSDLNVPVFKKK